MPPPAYRRASPPFRSGGRGSKQLSKALQDNAEAVIEPSWVLCAGKSQTYFAKIISVPAESTGNVLLQPLYQSPHDATLLKPWEGHLWLAKKEKLHPVQMRQEPGGWRVVETPFLKKKIEQLNKKRKGGSFTYPQNIITVRGREDWDTVSLESSEFDEASSVDSVLFPLLARDDKALENEVRFCAYVLVY